MKINEIITEADLGRRGFLGALGKGAAAAAIAGSGLGLASKASAQSSRINWNSDPNLTYYLGFAYGQLKNNKSKVDPQSAQMIRALYVLWNKDGKPNPDGAQNGYGNGLSWGWNQSEMEYAIKILKNASKSVDLSKVELPQEGPTQQEIADRERKEREAAKKRADDAEFIKQWKKEKGADYDNVLRRGMGAFYSIR